MMAGRQGGMLVLAGRYGRGVGHGLEGVSGAGQGRKVGRSAGYGRNGDWDAVMAGRLAKMPVKALRVAGVRCWLGGWQGFRHRLNMEVDLQSLFGLHVT